MADSDTSPRLKEQTAGSVKWNFIDKVSQQALYAVTGVVLANLLSDTDFGLVGAVLVFQAFASLLVDSGFSYALLQRKRPSRLDYSTVLWFNLAVAVAIYAVLFFCAPLIAAIFGHDARLIPLSRVMFLSFILNAACIVQVNRLMKEMRVKVVALSNSAGLFAGAVVGIGLAVAGYGAWAIVWQTLTLNAVKGVTLWIAGRWTPIFRFSRASLKSFFAVGSSMMATSFLNTLFQNIYSFFIGYKAGLAPLGYYTQADKWSKMGVTTVQQTLVSAFLPTLSEVQDDPARFARASAKMNRVTAYMLFPLMGFLTVMATPVFHCLFGTKWDLSIVLFQILLVRGIFTVLNATYSNYAMALARTRLVFWLEVVRDSVALLLLAVTIPWIAAETDGNMVWGLEILLWGQLLASFVTWIVTLMKTAPLTGRGIGAFLKDLAPYAALTLVAMATMWAESLWLTNPWGLFTLQGATGLAIYLGANALLGSKIQREALLFVFKRK